MKIGLQSLEFSFEADTMTHDGGVLLIQRFGHQLGFRRRLQRLWRDVPNCSKHDPLDMVQLLLFLLIVVIQRLHKSDKIQYDGFVLALLGMEPCRMKRVCADSCNAYRPKPFASWCAFMWDGRK